MSRKWAIIADDFTGAGDSAVQFVSCGKPVFLLIDRYSDGITFQKHETVVINTDTRFLDGKDAYRKVASATRMLYELGYRAFFKKIDSTLRGNIAEEIAAVMDAGGFRFVIVAPAAPRNRRTVINGVCLIDGVPLTDTSIGRDPFNPVNIGRISEFLQIRFPGAVEELFLSDIRSGSSLLRSKIEDGLARGIRVFIADAETMEDLKIISNMQTMPGILFAGSSGLAEAIADGKKCSTAVRHDFPRKAVLFVIGSLTEKTIRQCNRLLEVETVEELVVDTSRALNDPSDEITRIMEHLNSLQRNCPLLLRTDHILRGRNGSAIDKNVGLQISQFMGSLARVIAQECSIKLIIASGGDTAARIIETLDTDCIRFVDEIIPGIPYGYFKSNALGRKIYYVSKSGGFGDEDAMVECLRIVSPLMKTLGRSKNEIF
ncbi:MAG: four-carbon acid sugar kinase family protein [Rectinemataceae bacterium]|nr:hypothetical protein [Spirochaetaceae bacterium]